MAYDFQKTWREEELEEMGFNKVVIGVPGRPLPIMVPNPNARTQEDTYRLEMMEDEQHPIILWSRRPYAEVIGMLYRLLPTPSMLPLYYETLQLLQVENSRRIQFYIGKHGSGKSFLGKLVGDMLHPEGSVTMNCADRDLNELLFETVLDVQSNPSLYATINARLREGSMNAASVAALKAVTGEAFGEKDGAPYIDFESIGHTKLETFTNEDGLHETRAVFSDADATRVMETLLRIAQVEGLSKEASFMPIRSQLGVLPKVWEEGRVAHLEEYNKCKEGTDTALHGVLQLFNGESTVCRVFGTGGMSYTFDNRERHPGFFCYMDGNMMQDGVATHSLSASANDRLLPNIIQDMIREDWQHRWCQMLTGMPIRIFYESKRDQWDADPESFTRFLQMIRGLGVKEVPAAHRHYINRWEDVLDATDIISRYNSLYDEMTNPDSAANREGKYPELFSEVDDEFHNMAGGSMRRNIYYFKMALLGRPQTKAPNLSQGYDLSTDWNRPPEIDVSKDGWRPEERLGTNIVEIFYRDMVRLTIGLGKVNLYNRLKVAFESLRMMRPALSEGNVAEGVYLEDLLNSEVSGNNQNSKLQAVFCDLLRSALPNTPLSSDNDHLMTADLVGGALQKAWDLQVPDIDDPRLAFVLAQSFAPLATVDNLIQPFALLDSSRMADGRQVNMRDEDLMEYERFLTALALPKVGARNLDACWTRGLLEEVDSPLLKADPALQMCSGQHPQGLAVSTFVMRSLDGGGARVTVHILRDTRKQMSLVIGDKVSDGLRDLLKDGKVDFVDRAASNCKARIRTFLNRALMQAGPDADALLSIAVLHRNLPEGQKPADLMSKLDSLKALDLLADASLKAVRPVYVTKLSAGPKIKAYLKQEELKAAVQA